MNKIKQMQQAGRLLDALTDTVGLTIPAEFKVRFDHADGTPAEILCLACETETMKQKIAFDCFMPAINAGLLEYRRRLAISGGINPAEAEHELNIAVGKIPDLAERVTLLLADLTETTHANDIRRLGREAYKSMQKLLRILPFVTQETEEKP